MATTKKQPAAAKPPTIPENVLAQFGRGGFAGGFLQDPATGRIYQTASTNSWGDGGGSSYDPGGFYSYMPRYNESDGNIQMGVNDQYQQFDQSGKFTGGGAFKDAGSGMDLLATMVLTAVTMGAALPATAGAGVAAGGGGGAAGLSAAGLSGVEAGVITAAEAAAGGASFAESLAPFLSNAGTAGAGLSAYVPTAAEVGAQATTLTNQLSPFLAKGATAAAGAAGGGSGTAGGLGTKAVGAAGTAAAGGAGGGGGGAGGGSGLQNILNNGGSVRDWLGLAGSLVGPATAVLGGKLGADASKDAAATQLQSARESNALLKYALDKQIALQEPFRVAGVKANTRAQELLGIGGDAKAADYGSHMRDFTRDDFYADPGYEWRLEQGQQALDRAAASGGRFNSGRAMKDIVRFGQGEASQEYGNAFNRFQVQKTGKLNPLLSMSGAGQTSAGTVGQATQNYGTAAGANITGAGNAAAAGQVGAANAWTGALSNGMSMYAQGQDRAQQNALLQHFLQRG